MVPLFLSVVTFVSVVDSSGFPKVPVIAIIHNKPHKIDNTKKTRAIKRKIELCSIVQEEKSLSASATQSVTMAVDNAISCLTISEAKPNDILILSSLSIS